MSAIDTLRKARGLLEKGWTKGAYARNAEGQKTAWLSPEATCWCARGALLAAAEVNGDFYSENWDNVNKITSIIEHRPCGGLGLLDFNDAQDTVEPILAVFDEVIAELEAANEQSAHNL